MARLSFWLRWSWRDLRRRWVSVVAIALVIALGTGLYAGLGSMEEWRKRSNDASFELLHAHDLKATLTEGDFARGGRLRAVARGIPGASSIERAQERLAVPTQLDLSASGAGALTAGRVVGVEVAPQAQTVDGISVEEGRGVTRRDSGRKVAVLEAGYAEFHDLPSSGRVEVSGGDALRYVGTGRSPEYFLVTRQGGGEFGGGEAGYGVLFTTLPTAQLLAGRRDSVNELVLTLEPGADAAAVREQLEAALTKRGLGAEVTSFAEEPAYRVLYRDAEGDQRVFNVFAYLILAGAAFAAFNLASRIVEAQRREIGVGMALGTPPAALAVRPLLLGTEIALLGVVCGLLFGLWITSLFSGLLEGLLPLPVIETSLEPGVFLRGAALGFLLPLLATALPVWRAVRVPPVEAIRVGFRSVRASRLVAALRGLRLPGRSLSQMPFRNVARAPRRTLTTALAIAAVVTVVVALLAQIDSFLGAVDDAEAEIGGETPSRVHVTLDGFYAEDSPEVRAIRSDPAVGETEARLRVPVTMLADGREVDASLELLDADSEIWRPTIAEGSFRPGAAGLVISQEAGHDLGVGVGDAVTLRYPVRAGDGSFELQEAPVEVGGVHPNPFRTFAYMDDAVAAAVGFEEMTNLIVATPAPGHPAKELERSLFGLRGVASSEAATAFAEPIDRRMEDFVEVLQVTEAFALALALLIAFNSSGISVEERRREYATMFAFGVPLRSAIRIAVTEGLVVGALGALLGIAFGLAVVQWVLSTILPDTVPELGIAVTISAGSLATAALVGIAAVALAPLLTARRLRRMDVPSTLRVVE
jgi:putative ABC transport system permease protein